MKKLLLFSFVLLFYNASLAQPYTISGHVYNNPAGGAIVSSALPLPRESLVVVLVSTATNKITHTAQVSYVVGPNYGSFSLSGVQPGEYQALLITPNAAMNFGDNAPPAVLETGWTRTGESITGGALDGVIDGKTATIAVVSANVTGVLFGLQERPFAYNKLNVSFDNTVTSPVQLAVKTTSPTYTQGGADILEGADNNGTLQNYTINALPKYGTLYLGDPLAPVNSLTDVASLTPTQFATLAYQPSALALEQEMDIFTYYVTDNASSKSNNAAYLIPFALLNSDSDALVDRDDQDDDNDGITDIAECALNDPTNNYQNLFAAYLATPSEFIQLHPSNFGFSAIPQQRVGLNLTQDVSSIFGKPNGSIIVSIINANTHPTADEFYVNDSTGTTQWLISGTLGAYTTIEHGQQFFSYDTRTITLLNATPKSVVAAQQQSPANSPQQANWSVGNDGGYSWWVTNDNPRTYPDPLLGLLAVALSDPEPKYFQVGSTANNRDEWATYFIKLLPECDVDNDGIPNRTDLDSDNDGCLDALEGSGLFDFDDLVDAEGRAQVGSGSSAENQNLPAVVDINGVPVVAAGSQSPVGTYDDSTISEICESVLPVNLLEFNAGRVESGVLLKWVTVSEQNNKVFEVERSNTGKSWKNIGFVKAQNNGTSSAKLYYTFTDNKPVNGQNLYRLKQIDLDGKFAYSPMRSVLNKDGQVILFPNPTSATLGIEGLKGGELVKIFDVLGRMVYQGKTDGVSIKLPDNLTNGVYNVQIIDNSGKRSVHKLVIKK